LTQDIEAEKTENEQEKAAANLHPFNVREVFEAG
jgi:hypothetical protein